MSTQPTLLQLAMNSRLWLNALIEGTGVDPDGTAVEVKVCSPEGVASTISISLAKHLADLDAALDAGEPSQ